MAAVNARAADRWVRLRYCWPLVAVLAILAAVAIVLLLPGEPCLEWNGWRWIRIWPRPEHCQP